MGLWFEWAEQIGMGEMGLSEQEFWALTMPVFWIKHAAFKRAEDRARALILEHSLVSVHREKRYQNALQQQVNALRRYPIRRTSGD